MAIVRVPAGAEHYDIEWCVEVGAEVDAGQTMAWLCAPGRCGLQALSAPVGGRVRARWTALLKVVRPGEAVAVVGDGDVAGVNAAGTGRLVRQVTLVREELRAVEAKRLARTGAGAALLEADAARLTQWLDEAQRALKEADVQVA